MKCRKHHLKRPHFGNRVRFFIACKIAMYT
nr:MAG TPA: hypothetical protein [Bacteriophage sp.]